MIGYTNGLIIILFLLVIFWALHKMEKKQDKKREDALLHDISSLETQKLMIKLKDEDFK